jgi:Glycosyl hydrolases family 39.
MLKYFKSSGAAALSTIALICAVTSGAYGATYTLSVKANQRTQAWNRYYERSISTDHMYTVLHSHWGRGCANALKVSNANCGFQMFRGHGILDADVNLVALNTDGSLKLNWSAFDSIYDAGKAANMWPILEIGFTPPALASSNTMISSLWYNGVSPNMSQPKDWNTWMNLMDSIVMHVENRYGAAVVRNNWYFEIWNEASWMYSGGEGGYQTLYDYSVTGLLKGDPNIKVGGPAYSAPSSIGGIPSLINHCLTGTNAATGTKGTKLDFVSYHKYGTDDDSKCGTGSVANATAVNCFHKEMVDIVKAIPAYKGELINDEWGPNSGINSARDLECCASFVAKTIHLLNENGAAYPPPAMFGFWALSDLYEENQNNISRYSFAEATQGIFIRGDPTISDSWEVGKPSYEAFRMLHKLGAFEVSCTGGKITDGLNAVATVSTNNDSIQILIYNHYEGNSQQPTVVDNVTLTVDSIPFAPAQIRAEHWVVDYSHSNAYRPWVTMGKPAQPTATQWAQLKQAAMLTHYDSVATPTLTGKSWSKTFTQNYYSVGLIILTKAGGVSTAPARPAGEIQTMRAIVQGKKVIIAMPLSGAYQVQLFTTGGRKIMEKDVNGPGKSVVSLAKLPTGAYILKCNNPGNSLKSLVIVE